MIEQASSSASRERERREGYETATSFVSAAQAKSFWVLGCGWWCDRKILLYFPLWRSRETTRETTRQLCHQGRKAADEHRPRHGRSDRKRERRFSGLKALILPGVLAF